MTPPPASSGPAALRARWEPAHEAELRNQLVAQARISKPPHRITSPWGSTPDGAVDLRGVVPRTMLPVRYLTLERVDLSRSGGHLAIIESEFTDSRFDGVTMLTGTSVGRRFERCSFRSANLREVSLGRLLIDCDLSRARLRALSVWPNTRFEGCDFTGADLTDATLTHATFVHCRFDGITTSSLTSFRHCAFEVTMPSVGDAQLAGSRLDGAPVADRWEGSDAAAALTEQYMNRYVAAAETGEAADLPLDPSS